MKRKIEGREGKEKLVLKPWRFRAEDEVPTARIKTSRQGSGACPNKIDPSVHCSFAITSCITDVFSLGSPKVQWLWCKLDDALLSFICLKYLHGAERAPLSRRQNGTPTRKMWLLLRVPPGCNWSAIQTRYGWREWYRPKDDTAVLFVRHEKTRLMMLRWIVH